MTSKDIPRTMLGSSHCPPQDPSGRSKAILELGKRLAAELDDNSSTLARWMSHYIAHLIVEAEEDQSDRQATKKADVAEAILRLWAHCSHFPDGHRPFEDFEPVIRTMNSLDPESSEQRYRVIWPGHRTKDNENEPEAQKWLHAAIGVDKVARILLRAFLRQAAHNAVDKSKEWVQRAWVAGVGEDQFITIVRFILHRDTDEKKPDLDEENKKRAEREIEQLEAFAKAAATLAQAMRQQIADGKLPKMEIPGGLNGDIDD